jgi:hypothetical protein
MSENLKTMGETAKGLARNPLGIIALPDATRSSDSFTRTSFGL